MKDFRLKLFPFFTRRRYVTLMEALIAMSLLTVMITFLFGYYREIDWMQSELDKTRQENFKHLYVQNRLSEAIMQTASFPHLIGNRDSLFYTSKDENSSLKENSLVFIYDNDQNVLSYFSHYVLGRLYIDRNDNLCLATWPSPQLWINDGKLIDESPMKNEILLAGVSNMSFSFFVPPSSEKKDVNPKKIETGQEKKTPPDEWSSDWLVEYQELPALVKITLSLIPKKNETDPQKLVFLFPLSNFKKPVIYGK